MVEEILVQQPDGSAVWGRREVPWNDVLAELDRLAADEAGGGVVPHDL